VKPKSLVLFIDSIDEDEVTVLLDEKPYRLPRALLPPGAREGMWLRLTVEDNPTLHKNIEDKRGRLLGSDPGGKIKL
jgi:hypothetical protein